MNNRMRLRAGCEMQIEADADASFVAMLRPRSGDAQWIVRESFVTEPFTRGVEYTDAFGNLCQRLQVPAERFELKTEVEIDVDAVLHVDPEAPLTLAAALPHTVLQYLLPSRYCPSERMLDVASEAARGAKPGYPQVAAFVTWIRDNIEYRYGVSDASTSALDTIDDKAGVCRDFAHIGIAFCRAMQIPARMVVGYLHGLEPMDLHAWFEAFVGDRWYTFDATQEAPRAGRIAVAYGRDATDVAIMTGFGNVSTKNMRVWVDKVGSAR